MVSKLSEKLKNAPRDTSLVSGSASLPLNRDQSLSVVDKVLTDNLGEENPLRPQMEQQHSRVAVYVVNMREKPLMPTTPRKARILLKESKAKVVKRNPFTIQLTYATGETIQSITLGIDAGYAQIGFSAVTKNRELLAGEVTLRKDVSKKLAERRMYRRIRRGRLWYRPPRFQNRKASKPKGWLAPSITYKIDTHLRLVEQIKAILPITKIIVEVASFDTHKMQKPEISGIEYQQGTLFGYTVRNYLLEKWRHQCAYCHKTNVPLEIDHVIPQSCDGSNRVVNLTIACQPCNQKKGNKLVTECPPTLRRKITAIQNRASKSFKAAAFMTMAHWRIVDRFKCQHTYGDRTKYQRVKLMLSKSHVNDAFVIAGGSSNHQRNQVFGVTQIRRNNRSLQTNRKGFKRSIRLQRYNIQPNDLVCYQNKHCRVKGMFNYGKWVRLVTMAGTILNSPLNSIQLIAYGKGLSFILNSSST